MKPLFLTLGMVLATLLEVSCYVAVGPNIEIECDADVNPSCSKIAMKVMIEEGVDLANSEEDVDLFDATGSKETISGQAEEADVQRVQNKMANVSGAVIKKTQCDMVSEWLDVVTDPNYMCTDAPETCAEANMSQYYGSYQRLAAIYARIDKLVAANSGFAKKGGSMGKTFKGNEQIYYELSDLQDNPSSKPVQFTWCAEHAREWVTAVLCVYMIEKLLAEEKQGLLSQSRIIILPVMNVDGFLFSQEPMTEEFAVLKAKKAATDTWPQTCEAEVSQENSAFNKIQSRRNHRTSMKPNPEACEHILNTFPTGYPSLEKCINMTVGTDLNRNWPSHWAMGGSSAMPGSDSYRGWRVGDQVEVKNLMTFSTKISKEGLLLSVIDVHCCMGAWLLPVGWGPCKTTRQEGPPTIKGVQCETMYEASPDYHRVWQMGNATVHAIQANQNPKKPLYKFGPIPNVIYPASGSSLDWHYAELGVVYASGPELFQMSAADEENVLLSKQPKSSLLWEIINEGYVGVREQWRYSLTDLAPAKATVPQPSPGYPLEFLCDLVKKHGLCQTSCDNMELQGAGSKGKLDLSDVDTNVVFSDTSKADLLDACGTYSRQRGDAMIHEMVTAGKPFKCYCSDAVCPSSSNDPMCAERLEISGVSNMRKQLFSSSFLWALLLALFIVD